MIDHVSISQNVSESRWGERWIFLINVNNWIHMPLYSLIRYATQRYMIEPISHLFFITVQTYRDRFDKRFFAPIHGNRSAIFKRSWTMKTRNILKLRSLPFRSSIECAVHCLGDSECIAFSMTKQTTETLCQEALGSLDYAMDNDVWHGFAMKIVTRIPMSFINYITQTKV